MIECCTVEETVHVTQIDTESSRTTDAAGVAVAEFSVLNRMKCHTSDEILGDDPPKSREDSSYFASSANLRPEYRMWQSVSMLVHEKDDEVVEFRAVLTRGPDGGPGYGLAFAPLSFFGHFVVMEVLSDGAVQTWNSSCIDAGQYIFNIRPGDRIVGVDHPMDIASMQRRLREQPQAELLIQRWPREMIVELERSSEMSELGITTECLYRADGGRMLGIVDIGPGLVEEWNGRARASNMLHNVIQTGAEILSVNDETGPHDVSSVIHDRQTMSLTIRIQRPLIPGVGCQR